MVSLWAALRKEALSELGPKRPIWAAAPRGRWFARAALGRSLKARRPIGIGARLIGSPSIPLKILVTRSGVFPVEILGRFFWAGWKNPAASSAFPGLSCGP